MEIGSYAFISYSSKNQAAADALRRIFTEQGIANWMAPYDIPSGSKYAAELNKALKNCGCLVLLLSEASQASEHVDREVERALSYKKPIVPVQIEDVMLNDSFEYYIGACHIIAVPEIRADSAALRRVLDGVRSFVGAAAPVAQQKSTPAEEGGRQRKIREQIARDFEIENGALVKYKGSGGDVVIPDGVTVIGERAFYDCQSLTAVTIPASVKRFEKRTLIFSGAFSKCQSLTRVTFEAGSQLENIGEQAFSHCTALTHIAIPDSVTCIESFAFSGCSGLTRITIPDNVTDIGEKVFGECTGLTGVTLSKKLTGIPRELFRGCTALTHIAIPNGVTSIDSIAFSGCSGLTGMTVEPGNSTYHSAGNCVIETAEKRLLWGCKNSVIPNDGSVTAIGDGAFQGCSGLSRITIPKCVTRIGSAVFSGCTQLAALAVEPGNPTYHSAGNCIIDTGKGVLVCGCKSSVIPNDGSVVAIGEAAFSGCSGLTGIILPEAITHIEDSAFYSCTGLAAITIPSSVTGIGGWAFQNCTALSGITIPHGITEIKTHTFNGCTALKAISIPGSVTEIGWNSLIGCTNLTRITFRGTKAQWQAVKKGSWWDDGTGDYTVCFTEAETDADFSRGLDFALSDDRTHYIVSGIGSCMDTEVVIPAEHNGLPVLEIGSAAFKGCTKLRGITIPDSIVNIGPSAFHECTCLKRTNISDLTAWCNIYFGNSASNPLYNNGMLYLNGKAATTIEIPDGVTAIGNSAFAGYTGLTDIIIPKSVVSIGMYAFDHCSGLTHITIPSSMTSIDWAAFPECTRLTRITYEGTKRQWESILGRFLGLTCMTGYTIHCTDGIIPKK